MKKLAKSLSSLVRSWWRVDRVRISPDQGRLLSLRLPCYVRIGAETVEIVGRRIAEKGLGVIYDCADGSELRVNLIGLNRALEVSWVRQGQAVELSVEEVAVFSR